MIEAEAPRSTWIHCGSLNALDHRVVAFPSTALAAGSVAFSVDEAVAGLPWDSRVVAAWAERAEVATRTPATSARTAVTVAITAGVRRLSGAGNMVSPPQPAVALNSRVRALSAVPVNADSW